MDAMAYSSRLVQTDLKEEESRGEQRGAVIKWKRPDDSLRQKFVVRIGAEREGHEQSGKRKADEVDSRVCGYV